MFLIMSSAYIGQELKSEFGQIPPSMLPLGNRRLIHHQLKSTPQGSKVFLSLPESYKLVETDEKWLLNNDVTVVRIPENLELGAALVAALNLIDCPLNKPLHVLFGDTLISPLPIGDDIIAISDVNDSYDWAIVTNDELNWLESSDNKLDVESNNIVSGYFKFSHPRELIKNITQCHWNFLEGLNRYHSRVGLNTVKIDNWLDFGHVNTYYRSKAAFTTQRAFNELKITPKWVEKSSLRSNKIKAEANWFEQIPYSMKGYIPQFLGSESKNEQYSYRLEYLYHTALNELFVFGDLPTKIWKKILESCLDFIDACLEHKAPKAAHKSNIDDLFGNKTTSRLSEYCTANDIDLEKKWIFNSKLSASLNDILSKSEKHLPKKVIPACVLHGDFCFSNILYDFRTARIKTVDPRGLDHENIQTIYGHVDYDIAKLSHSILGLYDWILAGYYELNIDDNFISFEVSGQKKIKNIQQVFITMIEEKYKLLPNNLYAMQIQLFLSMLPLHSDDKNRQNALLANAFRLYEILERYEK
ncbi:capsular biosynthesis protein [Vibrio vulnificus]|nr:capsular biosynthesis protein [Vibrio vulnificus]EIZ1360371.1 capsular biosynthesis protein [Vibrio vulnificus]